MQVHGDLVVQLAPQIFLGNRYAEFNRSGIGVRRTLTVEKGMY